jgi:hypothetical protein
MTENSYRICAVFTMKDQNSKDRFISFCNGDNGLSAIFLESSCPSYMYND